MFETNRQKRLKELEESKLEKAIKKNDAFVEYLAMMVDVELPMEESNVVRENKEIF